MQLFQYFSLQKLIRSTADTRITDTQLNRARRAPRHSFCTYHEKNAVVSRIICPNHWCVIDFCAPLFRRRCNANIFFFVCAAIVLVLTLRPNKTKQYFVISFFIYRAHGENLMYNNYVHSYISCKVKWKKSEMNFVYVNTATEEEEETNNTITKKRRKRKRRRVMKSGRKSFAFISLAQVRSKCSIRT